MARHYGGIFSRASGQTSGIVFSQVRTKQGKSMVSREKVIPQDPKSPNQLINRNRFAQLIRAIDSWGPSVYRELFNRSVGQLPGFQALESAINKSLGEDGRFVPSKDIATGNAFNWDTGSIDHGFTNADEIAVEVESLGEPYKEGTTLHVFGWTDFDGDWRTESDTEFYYESVTIEENSNVMSLVVELSDELIAGTSDSLVMLLVQHPANSPRPKSKTRKSSVSGLEIQEIKSQTGF